MNGLHGIRIGNDLAALKGAQVSYSPQLRQLILPNGEPLYWVFANREAAVQFAASYGAKVKPITWSNSPE